MSLEGKIALVTGAASGIGKSIAVELARQGAGVVVNYHSDKDPGQPVVDEITAAGGKAVTIQADVSNSDDINRMFQQAVEKFGKVDVLVNNAGIEHQTPFLEKSEQEWDHTLAVDLKGPFLCTQAAARDMVRRKERGTIISISSVHEDLPFPGYVDYCAAKGGLRMMCRDLALELAPYNINIVNVAPGAVATPINEATLDSPEKKAALLKEIPLGRVCSPEEIAKLVAYLATDDASYITGTTVVMDGGLMHQTGSL